MTPRPHHSQHQVAPPVRAQAQGFGHLPADHRIQEPAHADSHDTRQHAASSASTDWRTFARRATERASGVLNVKPKTVDAITRGCYPCAQPILGDETLKPQKLILSRKGFDSGSGGCPSPIFPDGSMFSLPIPSRDREQFADLQHGDVDISNVVTGITHGRMRRREQVHLDPDLNFNTYRYRKDRAAWQQWRGMLGQAGIAQSHLNNQGVGSGDVFLFFGLYRRVEETTQGWHFVARSPALHVLWGWLQVGRKYRVADIGPNDLPWARNHPHLLGGYRDDRNTVYAAAAKLDLGADDQCDIAGWGVFRRFDQRLVLTDPNGAGVSNWRLPRWFYAEGDKPPLTYHPDPKRWRRDADHAYLQTVGRGQEFVLDLAHYPEAVPWLSGLVSNLRDVPFNSE